MIPIIIIQVSLLTKSNQSTDDFKLYENDHEVTFTPISAAVIPHSHRWRNLLHGMAVVGLQHLGLDVRIFIRFLYKVAKLESNTRCHS